MATISELDGAGAIHRLDPSLPQGKQEFRCIYTSTKLRSDLEGKLAELGSTWRIELTPLEQLAELVEIFCSGEPLIYGWQFKPLRPLGQGVWELKTADLRIFGFFHKKDVFVAVEGLSAELVKAHRLYAGSVGAVCRFRDQLDLDEPKFIPGDDPNAVVSNCCFP